VHPDPWQTVLGLVDALPELETRTIEAVTAILDSSVPEPIVEAALLNLSTLRSETVFRVADGRFFAWEGVTDDLGSCYGTCTHVWGYEFATSYLFPEIARSFRETQYRAATGDDGHMVFRVGIGDDPRAFGLAAADGQMATLVHLYLDFRLGGDIAWLRELWPAARRSLEFAWIDGGWDPERSGVMTGCQHNTMDVEYYGPNPQMGTWYLAALRAGEELARTVGDDAFGAECRQIFERGSAWLDTHLFTGTHYRQIVEPPASGAAAIAAGLRHPEMGARSLDAPDFQIGEGVLVDQLVGQYAARLVGLGDVVDREHVAQTLATIFARNRRSDFGRHFNPTRSFVGAGETGLVMCAYEGVERPAIPFPYFGEVMTGFEYTAATGMILDGDRADGLAVITATRARYTGVRRNPFDEAECGHHYARALASWSAFVAWTGFDYDAATATMTFIPTDAAGSTFWSTGSAWGRFTHAPGEARLEVFGGALNLGGVRLGDRLVTLPGAATRTRGDLLDLPL
jgi:non-lysosomal glucosylceramidase